MDIGRVDEIKTAFDDDNKSASETEKTETISENCVEDPPKTVSKKKIKSTEKYAGRKWSCDECDYKATLKGSLKVHK